MKTYSEVDIIANQNAYPQRALEQIESEEQ